ncbi:hypothetical protein [Paenibacillus sp. JDR-2]|uniref:hypothetical protein n=1 Tax=Paenibacillus sp. (strain JDR-2) TaxID=324057 RepID=UPI000166A4F6|nr:hypothetical protein [Paenibacillus sp. JDR-2]ACT00216.1 hypothetical protein Pjdr2_1544 [Paenibacillus sp. JDR-2]
MKKSKRPRTNKLKTDLQNGFSVREKHIADIEVSSVAASAAAPAGAVAATASTASTKTITTGINQPAWPRNITATAGGTATDIKAIQVVVEGTNFADEKITETLPAFTVDTAGIVTGNKAFKTISKITIPAHDGTGATTSIGFGTKLGLPYRLDRNSVIAAYRNGAREATAPTITLDAVAMENNTFTLSSALNGTQVNVELTV